MVTKHQSEKRVRDDDSDTDSDNQMLMKGQANLPRFLIVKSASEDFPLQKLSPFAVQKGFHAIVGNPEEHQKTERWLLLGGVRRKGPGPKPTPNKPIY